MLKDRKVKWQICNSYNGVKLPLKPDPNMEEFLKYLSPLFSPRAYAKKTYIVRGFGDYILNEKDFSKIRKKIEKYFGLRINYNGHNHYIYNRTLHRFLLTFYNFRSPWDAIHDGMENTFLQDWNLLRV